MIHIDLYTRISFDIVRYDEKIFFLRKICLQKYSREFIKIDSPYIHIYVRRFFALKYNCNVRDDTPTLIPNKLFNSIVRANNTKQNVFGSKISHFSSSSLSFFFLLIFICILLYANMIFF